MLRLLRRCRWVGGAAAFQGLEQVRELGQLVLHRLQLLGHGFGSSTVVVLPLLGATVQLE